MYIVLLHSELCSSLSCWDCSTLTLFTVLFLRIMYSRKFLLDRYLRYWSSFVVLPHRHNHFAKIHPRLIHANVYLFAYLFIYLFMPTDNLTLIRFTYVGNRAYRLWHVWQYTLSCARSKTPQHNIVNNAMLFSHELHVFRATAYASTGDNCSNCSPNI